MLVNCQLKHEKKSVFDVHGDFQDQDNALMHILQP